MAYRSALIGDVLNDAQRLADSLTITGGPALINAEGSSVNSDAKSKNRPLDFENAKTAQKI